MLAPAPAFVGSLHQEVKLGRSIEFEPTFGGPSMSPVIWNPPFVDSASMEEKAGEVREQAGIITIPVDPFAIAAKLNVEVLQVTFEDDEVEGVLRACEGRPQILVRASSILTRRKFTVAHELGHYLLHWSSDDSSGDPAEFVDSDMQLYRRGEIRDPQSKAARSREIQANMFAAALLMPKDALAAFVPMQPSVRELARTFGVSETAMHYRINELDVW